jgi:hypothetical protein
MDTEDKIPPSLPLQKGGITPLWQRRLCHNSGNGERCHAELVSASNGINNLRDPEILRS